MSSGRVRTVEIGGDVEAGKAFEDHLFNRMSVAFELACDSRIEGTTIGGQTADELRHFVDLNPEFEVPVERLATFLARLDDEDE